MVWGASKPSVPKIFLEQKKGGDGKWETIRELSIYTFEAELLNEETEKSGIKYVLKQKK